MFRTRDDVRERVCVDHERGQRIERLLVYGGCPDLLAGGIFDGELSGKFSVGIHLGAPGCAEALNLVFAQRCASTAEGCARKHGWCVVLGVADDTSVFCKSVAADRNAAGVVDDAEKIASVQLQ